MVWIQHRNVGRSGNCNDNISDIYRNGVATMKLEDQVCSLELAKRLKELGVKQESLFRWVEWKIQDSDKGRWELNDDMKALPYQLDRMKLKWCAAFSVAELGEMLPWAIVDGTFVAYKTSDKCYHLYLQSMGITKKGMPSYNEANCRAKMLIWLIENGKVKV